jgi:hypothetical protein
VPCRRYSRMRSHDRGPGPAAGIRCQFPFERGDPGPEPRDPDRPLTAEGRTDRCRRRRQSHLRCRGQSRASRRDVATGRRRGWIASRGRGGTRVRVGSARRGTWRDRVRARSPEPRGSRDCCPSPAGECCRSGSCDRSATTWGDWRPTAENGTFRAYTCWTRSGYCLASSATASASSVVRNCPVAGSRRYCSVRRWACGGARGSSRSIVDRAPRTRRGSANAGPNCRRRGR